MSVEETVAKLRARLAALPPDASPATRGRLLYELGDALATRVRGGDPGLLDEAVDVLASASELLGPRAARPAFLHGGMLALRHLAFDGPAADRDGAIAVLEAVLDGTLDEAPGNVPGPPADPGLGGPRAHGTPDAPEGPRTPGKPRGSGSPRTSRDSHTPESPRGSQNSHTPEQSSHAPGTRGGPRDAGGVRRLGDLMPLGPGDTRAARFLAGLLRLFRIVPAQMRGGGPPDLGAVIGALMGAGTPGLDSARDVTAAVEHLSPLAADEGAPAELRAHANGLLTLAALIRGLGGLSSGRVDFGEMLAAVSRASALMRPPATDPRAAALTALLGAADLRLDPEPEKIDVVIETLSSAVERGDEDDVLLPILLRELGLAHAMRAERTGSDADLDAAPEYLERALETMRPGHPFHDETLRQVGGALLSRTAFRPTHGGVEKVIEVARRIEAGRRDAADPADRAKDLFLLGMAELLRAEQDGGRAGFQEAVETLKGAAALIPADDSFAPLIVGVLGAALSDRHTFLGRLEDADAARFFLTHAHRVIALQDVAGQDASGRDHAPGTVSGPVGRDRDLLALRIVIGLTGAVRAMHVRDPDELDRAVDLMGETLSAVHEGHPWRGRVTGMLGAARTFRGAARNDGAEIEAGVALMIEAAETATTDPADRPALLARGGMAWLIRGLSGDDRGFDRGMELLGRAEGLPDVPAGLAPRLEWAMGIAYRLRHERLGAANDLGEAIAHLERARRELEAGRTSTALAPVLEELSGAYRAAGRDGEAIATGLAGLRARADDVLLQAEPSHGLTVARGAADAAHRVAGWALAGGLPATAVEALELGRGLVLHATAGGTGLHDLLAGRGHADLAAAWAAARPPGRWEGPRGPATGEGVPGEGTPDGRTAEELMRAVVSSDPPDELRQAVLAVLRDTGAYTELRSAPEPKELAAAMGGLGVGSLVYLLPGYALILGSDGELVPVELPELRAQGPVADYAAAHTAFRAVDDKGGEEGKAARRRWHGELRRLCEWAWTAAMAGLLEKVPPGRVVLVPTGMLGIVPWHAAVADDGSPALSRACFSYAASGRQFARAAARERLPLGRSPLLVGDPTADLRWSGEEALALRDAFYEQAVSYGRFDGAEGPGTPAEVLAGLASSMAHLACHAVSADPPSSSHLVLAGGERLTVGEILGRRPPDSPGGLVVLSSCTSDLSDRDHDETLTLATAFLAAGAAGVVGSRWLLPDDPRTPALMFAFHHFLARDPRDTAGALRAAQLWMLASPPPRLEGMPAEIADRLDDLDTASPVVWAAFTHHGR